MKKARLRRPKKLRIADLMALVPRDLNEVFKNRLLCRLGAMLLAGPTGVGKSTLHAGSCIQWALGRESFGFCPSQPLRLVVLDGENDVHDLREQLESTLKTLQLTAEERGLVNENLLYVSETRLVGDRFCELVRRVALEHRADLILIDPVLAFFGGDANSQVEVGNFLRKQLRPVLEEVHAAAILTHHVAKPAQGRKGKSTQRSDSYVGAGSAEFANFCRTVVSLEPTEVEDQFVLRISKRGKRAGWHDEAGQPTTKKYLRHSPVPGELRWIEITAAEHAAGKGSVNEASPEPSVEEFVAIFPDDAALTPRDNLLDTAQLKDAVKRRGWDVGRYARYRDAAIEAGLIETINLARGAKLAGLKHRVARYQAEKE